LEPGDIRDAMYKVFREILSQGILPALGQHILHASKLGIFESQKCLGCLQDVPEMLLNMHDFDALSQILSMCTGQHFFQALCTRIVESTLLGKVHALLTRLQYVFSFDLWK
jgi:hypothetical protein